MLMQSNVAQICLNCVMDTSDPDIHFNENGICNHCNNYELRKSQIIFSVQESKYKIDSIIASLKKENEHKKYDCIIGLSGGIDSSYLAYWASRVAKLRLLAVHVDAGWNSEIATSNIEKLVKTLGIDLHTHVFDWNVMQDLQLAFLRSGVANQDTPQDHAFFAALYNFASQHNIKTILSGYNFVSESVLPGGWGHSAMDLDQIKDIHKKFGKNKLAAFPQVSFLRNYIYYPLIKKMKVLSPLNYIDYNPFQAIEVLEKEIGWKYYGGKHYESRFTKFFQSYWLPERFGFDKRRAHLSSLILSRIISRSDALKQLEEKPYNVKDMEFDKLFIAKKLGLSSHELELLMQIPIKHYSDYANNQNKMKIFSRMRYIFSLPETLCKRIFKRLSW